MKLCQKRKVLEVTLKTLLNSGVAHTIWVKTNYSKPLVSRQ